MPDGDVKRTVTVTLELDAELVEAAEAAGPSLSVSVTRALRRHIGTQRRMTDAEIALYVQMANDHHDRFGSAADGHFPG